MGIKEFFFKICKDIFVVSFVTLAVFGLFEWFEPGFVSYYLSFNWLLIIPLVSGTVAVILDKK